MAPLTAPWSGAVRLERRYYHRIKRIMDVTLTLAALLVAVPIIAAAAALIFVESGGPVFYTQPRTGLGGKRFRMFKLRTMVRNAEEMKSQLAELNELTWPDFKISNDPRITRVGRVLRATSIDELPQLFNVLLGDMSLVGPRPTSFEAQTYDLWHTERLEVQPGITGLWQISGRSDVDFDERARLDIDYIERCSLWLDIRILFATVFAVLGRRGAY